IRGPPRRRREAVVRMLDLSECAQLTAGPCPRDHRVRAREHALVRALEPVIEAEIVVFARRAHQTTDVSFGAEQRFERMLISLDQCLPHCRLDPLVRESRIDLPCRVEMCGWITAEPLQYLDYVRHALHSSSCPSQD